MPSEREIFSLSGPVYLTVDDWLKMVKVGDGSLGRLATQNSIGSLLSGALGRDSEPAHLIPSAYLTINLSPSEDFKKAHGIHQWWTPNMQCQFKLHQFK
ncbi:hypothetical protein ACSBR1_008655 [Camellia fascicularis]